METELVLYADLEVKLVAILKLRHAAYTVFEHLVNVRSYLLKQIKNSA